MCEGAQLILHCKATITMYLKFVSDTHPVHADDVRPLHQSYQHKICYLQCFKCPTQLLHPCPLQILSAARPPPSCSPTPQPSPKSRGVEGCVEGWGGWWYLVDNMVREEELRVDGSGKSSPSIICNNANFSTVMNLCEDSDRVGWWLVQNSAPWCMMISSPPWSEATNLGSRMLDYPLQALTQYAGHQKQLNLSW